MNIKGIIPYILNFKAIVGIGLIGFGIYSMVTDIPPKWGTYFKTIATNQELEKSKENLSVQEANLKAIYKELDKFPTKTVKVQAGDAPELAMINIAQKVADLSETTHNTYISLKPGAKSTLIVDSAVSLPLNIPGSSSGSSPAPAPATSGKADLDAFEYSLSVKGTYANLATFIHELCKMSDFVLIKSVTIKPYAGSQTPEDVPNPNDISMDVDFSIPWKQ